jgi:hypothetical protein
MQQLIALKYTPEQANAPIANIYPPFVPYRDAGYGPCTYTITILDCLQGVYKAMVIGLIDVRNMDPMTMDFYERVENGDLNWLSRKFLALASPKDDSKFVRCCIFSSLYVPHLIAMPRRLVPLRQALESATCIR